LSYRTGVIEPSGLLYVDQAAGVVNPQQKTPSPEQLRVKPHNLIHKGEKLV